MKTVEILRGGSGKWSATIDGKAIAGGHVPSGVAPEEFESAVIRQMRRRAAEKPGRDAWKSLGGGSRYRVEIDDGLAEALLWRRAEGRRVSA
jgi:hypothetical protein